MSDNEKIIVSQLNPPLADDPDGTQRRLTMIARHREMIEAYASRPENADHVFLVLDLNCEFAKTIAIAGSSKEEVERSIRENSSDSAFATMLSVLPRWTAYKILRFGQTELHRQNQKNPRISTIVEQIKYPAKDRHVFIVALSRGKQCAEIPIPK